MGSRALWATLPEAFADPLLFAGDIRKIFKEIFFAWRFSSCPEAVELVALDLFGFSENLDSERPFGLEASEVLPLLLLVQSSQSQGPKSQQQQHDRLRL